MTCSSRQHGSNNGRELVSVVLPVFNEANVITALADAVADALHESGCRSEILFVNDGSTDDSEMVLDRLAEREGVRVLHLSRNFGHQAAVQAGIANARGDAVIVMDSDMQDDPSCLGQFIEKWRAGFDVVYAVRHDRKEAWWKRFLFYTFYRLLNVVSQTPIPADAGNFGLVDRRVADRLTQLSERDFYYSGLRHWVGFRQIGIPIERLARHDGNPRVSLWQLFRLAKTAIFSFSRAPLSFFYLVALLSMALFTFSLCFTMYHRMVTGLAIPGWTSITMTASFFGALNALGISVLGEYVIRIYDQVRARPPYIVQRESKHMSTGSCSEPDHAIVETIGELQQEAQQLLAADCPVEAANETAAT